MSFAESRNYGAPRYAVAFQKWQLLRQLSHQGVGRHFMRHYYLAKLGDLVAWPALPAREREMHLAVVPCRSPIREALFLMLPWAFGIWPCRKSPCRSCDHTFQTTTTRTRCSLLSQSELKDANGDLVGIVISFARFASL